MTEPLSDETWGRVFDPLAKKHFTDADREKLKARQTFDQEAIGAQWTAIIAEVTDMMERGVNPASELGMNMARRWKALQDLFTGGDPDLSMKARAMWQEAMADPESAPKLPMNTALFAYVGKAGEALKAEGG